MAIEPIAPISAQIDPISNQAISTTTKSSFESFMQNATQTTNDKLVDADIAVRDLALGKSQNLHEVMISLEEAKISFELMVQVRNKIVEAYQEILRMRI
ncbi:MAG: flagellar hook-basal body complex protein FliE [Gammaproteobacteria bacterium]|nr:MAG: flagellar hook-basal body complex protein FliE [Gammaproteobacteria bacterium]